MSRETVRAVERVASFGLDGASADPIEFGDDGAEFIAHLERERVLGMAVAAVGGGSLVGPDDVLTSIISRHDEVMHQTMRVEIGAVKLSQRLTAAGVDHRFLKGVALAHTLASSSADRSYRDVDVLVRSDDIAAVVELLRRDGATRLQPELRPGYDRRFAKSVTLRIDSVEVDIHRLLCPGPFGVWMRPNELFLLKRTFLVAGTELPTLDPTDHLVHACYHVALGQVTPVLSNLRDVAMLAAASVDPVDPERFAETVKRWRGGPVIKRAVREVQARLDAELPEWLVSYAHQQFPIAELDQIAPYLDDDPSGRFAALAPATLRALPMSERAAYAMAVGLPDGSDAVGRVRDLLRRRSS